MKDREELIRVKGRHLGTLMAISNVVGVGIGYKLSKGQQTKEPCLKLLVREKITKEGLDKRELIPASLDGVATDVFQVGELWAQESWTGRYRPAPGGVSIGHYQISAGTLGVVVRDRVSGARLILSNNHVLANSNNASVGDAILQPGGADGGTVQSDTIAHLERFCPIEFGQESGSCGIAASYAHLGNALAAIIGSQHRVAARRVNLEAVNVVDAAVAKPVNDADVLDEILKIGQISGTVEAQLGMSVRKSGRTTGYTTGEILTIDATVSVNYGGGRTATFENQLISGPMSQGGDSGSLVVAGDSQEAVGLLFAGSDQSTIFNPITPVLDCLEVEL